MAEKFNPKEHLTDLKGKAYLEVKWRLVWFREEKATWSIGTELLQLNLVGAPEEQFAMFKATICDENGVVKATGHGSETRRDFGDFIEKAESKAVGRALGYLGYGTQFAPDLEEGSRVVDSPVHQGQAARATAQATRPAAQAAKPVTLEEALETIPFTKGPNAGIKMGLLDRSSLEFIIQAPKASPGMKSKAAQVLASRKTGTATTTNGASHEADEALIEEPSDEYMKANGINFPA